ncbi:hypothetical protein ACLOJK_015201 [Asimina triloba]
MTISVFSDAGRVTNGGSSLVFFHGNDNGSPPTAATRGTIGADSARPPPPTIVRAQHSTVRRLLPSLSPTTMGQHPSHELPSDLANDLTVASSSNLHELMPPSRPNPMAIPNRQLHQSTISTSMAHHSSILILSPSQNPEIQSWPNQPTNPPLR